MHHALMACQAAAATAVVPGFIAASALMERVLPRLLLLLFSVNELMLLQESNTCSSKKGAAANAAVLDLSALNVVRQADKSAFKVSPETPASSFQDF